jgi:hypothetical protein
MRNSVFIVALASGLLLTAVGARLSRGVAEGRRCAGGEN